ncbi:PH domain-containing protein [Glaciecola sp. XM2]|jgi:putative membrane protein|uniref:PH domain-containing protein n=1 Tax=Glaciecola sp. XM2 TaxID=1914931 RepID=UPI001BDE9DFC|nr:PH domain-containing protein [Glaciecola sp. XM2]MBT1450194.1 PH domain-containing protein [Glaciecola sp. XM2]
MQEKVLASATFDPKVKRYWLVFWLLLCMATVMAIPLIPIVVIVVLFVAQRMLDAMSAELLERKLVVKRGILFKVEKSIPLEKITDVGMIQGPLMRAFGLHHLNFETAGQSGPGALVSMLGIEHPAEFREKILAQKDKISGSFQSEAKASSAGDDEMTQLLASVKRIEALLEQSVNKPK